MILRVKITPNSSRFNSVLKKDEKGFYLKIWVKSHPEKGKANKEMLRELKKLFGSVEIVSGTTSREKYIKIEHTTKELEEIIRSGKNN